MSAQVSDVQLPALIDRATRWLAEARTSAEVLEAKAAAEAALHYAKVTKAANETQADFAQRRIRQMGPMGRARWRAMKRLIIAGHEVLIERDPDGWWRCTIDRADHSATLHQTEDRAEAYARVVCSAK